MKLSQVRTLAARQLIEKIADLLWQDYEEDGGSEDKSLYQQFLDLGKKRAEKSTRCRRSEKK